MHGASILTTGLHPKQDADAAVTSRRTLPLAVAISSFPWSRRSKWPEAPLLLQGFWGLVSSAVCHLLLPSMVCSHLPLPAGAWQHVGGPEPALCTGAALKYLSFKAECHVLGCPALAVDTPHAHEGQLGSLGWTGRQKHRKGNPTMLALSQCVARYQVCISWGCYLWPGCHWTLSPCGSHACEHVFFRSLRVARACLLICQHGRVSQWL